MTRSVLCFAAIVFLVPSLCADEPAAAQYSFLVGSYECVGRWPDSNKTYSGRVEISPAAHGVKLIRTINGQRIKASGEFGTATSDKIQVFNAAFEQHGQKYEETCMVTADLDNYPRLTCYLYTTNTKKVGLETLFHDHGQLRSAGSDARGRLTPEIPPETTSASSVCAVAPR